MRADGFPGRRAASAALLSAALLLCLLAGCKADTPEPTPTGGGPKISYASEGVTAVEDETALQAAVDEMYEKAGEDGVALEYRNDAASSDGKTFTCYIANSVENGYDMFIALYKDAELTEQLYLSGLIRPGTAFKSVTLDSALEQGTHTVYCAFTQMEEDLETIHAQVIVTMEFTVS